ncbi:hypothetical protein PoB_003188300 [Plakobranchus ocellatus]|uniref:Uncharacterized protein n=1 Tax=Plakobranchus ocellatus TaxID=259542 RepID=A0AAV4ADS4_9GAST|nr:hypothetical protein PoB_003188300 [Plakobranchus ocellatus]
MYFRISGKAKAVAMEYEAFRDLKSSVPHPSLKVLRQWNQMERVVEFVRGDGACGDDQKHTFLMRGSEMLNAPRSTSFYSPQDLALANSWISLSCVLYVQLRNHLQLPSPKTLNRISMVAKSREDIEFYKSTIKNLNDRNKLRIVIVDEVYVESVGPL